MGLDSSLHGTKSGVLIAQITLQPTQPFKFHHRQPGQAWKVWRQQFSIYLDVSDYDSAANKKRHHFYYMPVVAKEWNYSIRSCFF